MNILVAALLSLLPKKYLSFVTPYEIPTPGAALSGVLIISLLHAQLGSWRDESQMGKRIPDRVECVEAGLLQISSCRPKPWNRLTTISYDDVLYDLDSTKKGRSPRQFVYLLRKKPISGVVRGLHHYSPDDVLTRDPSN
jgi:hypothetical protein